MSLYRSVRAVTGATGEGAVDWSAVSEAAKTSTEPGELDIDGSEQSGYAEDVKAARDRVRAVTTIEFDLPETIEVQNRHHWLDANIDTFERLLSPLEQQAGTVPGLAQILNTGSTAFALSFMARHVLGQYDPLLLSNTDDHALYFVRPNIKRSAEQLGAPYDRFRRWIAFHEVTHAAEFGAAPWLSSHLESTMQDAIENLSSGQLDREAMETLNTTMTAVEGYAELVMDRAFDEEYADLRQKLEARREGRGPIERLTRRVLGLSVKRQQYERGKEFFDTVVSQRDIETAGRVWESAEMLPTEDELDSPSSWLARTG